ncbi:MAG: SRPBCC family protein [Methylotenera sp.]|nr:SRPBCC family protein [Methylotenera sp.]
MKYLRWLMMMFSAMPLLAIACGPSPQKVSKEITIHAEPATVWAMVRDFGAMQKWHPDVLVSKLENKPDTEGKAANFRTLTLKNGGSITEKQRETQAEEMKLGVVMIEGDIAVSSYSDAISVKPSQVAGETVVTWVGRFNNKANAMQAPAGQDNAAAIAAVSAHYGAGLQGLKQVLEMAH